MILEDTIATPDNVDWVERLKEEYHALVMRRDKLDNTLIKFEAQTLGYDLTCPYELLVEQRNIMDSYIRCLRIRAEYQGVEL